MKDFTVGIVGKRYGPEPAQAAKESFETYQEIGHLPKSTGQTVTKVGKPIADKSMEKSVEKMFGEEEAQKLKEAPKEPQKEALKEGHE